jgi:hypothetical protein
LAHLHRPRLGSQDLSQLAKIILLRDATRKNRRPVV